MPIRRSLHGDHVRQLDTAGLRCEFLIGCVFDADACTMTQNHIDKITERAGGNFTRLIDSFGRKYHWLRLYLGIVGDNQVFSDMANVKVSEQTVLTAAGLKDFMLRESGT